MPLLSSYFILIQLHLECSLQLGWIMWWSDRVICVRTYKGLGIGWLASHTVYLHGYAYLIKLKFLSTKIFLDAIDV